MCWIAEVCSSRKCEEIVKYDKNGNKILEKTLYWNERYLEGCSNNGYKGEACDC